MKIPHATGHTTSRKMLFIQLNHLKMLKILVTDTFTSDVDCLIHAVLSDKTKHKWKL